ncbi:hypothetical protein F4678DRAFT_456229 [Xylaria arbuscula]|nr:hypothetical protein F4678DRAFT_456229 [Xylaria arbuscula]
MAPPASEFVSILSNFLQGGGLAESQTRLDMLDDMISPDVKFEVVGEDSPIACNTQGLDNMKRFITDNLVPFSSAIVDKPSFEIVRAVGSQDNPWIAFEFKSKGTSKAGKPYENNGVWMLRIDDTNKVAEAKGFMDTGHLQRHFIECKGL